MAERFAVAAAFTLLGVSLAFRLLWLDRLPGINGDEAWYGVQVLRCLHGEPWSGRTPTGLPINPLLFVTEWILLLCCKPSFWVLRLPILIWSLVGLSLTYVFYRWVYRDGKEALFALCLTACLPAHLAYSRFCWDGSFAFASFPLFMFPLLRLLEGHRGATEISLLIIGSVLTVWVHATHALLVIAGLFVLAWHFREACVATIRRRPVTSAAILISATFVAAQVANHSHAMRNLIESVSSSAERLPQHLSGLAEFLLGPRVFEYLSGVPAPEWLGWLYPVFYLVIAWLIFSLCRWGSNEDRNLAVLSVGLLALVLLAGRMLRLHRASYERYILYLEPLIALIAVRGLRAMGRSGGAVSAGVTGPFSMLGVSAFCLMNFWYSYFDPLHHQTYATRVHRTFQSDRIEPKAAAADAIRHRSRASLDTVTVYAEDWWLQYALEYLLDGRGSVSAGVQPKASARAGFVVGFSGSAYMEEVIAAAEKRHELRELVELGHNGDSPILTLVVLGPSPPDIKPLHTPSAVETKRDCADGLTRRFDCRNL